MNEAAQAPGWVELACVCCGGVTSFWHPSLEEVHNPRCKQCPEECRNCGKCREHCSCPDGITN